MDTKRNPEPTFQVSSGLYFMIVQKYYLENTCDKMYNDVTLCQKIEFGFVCLYMTIKNRRMYDY